MRIPQFCVRTIVGCVVGASLVTAGGASARADDPAVTPITTIPADSPTQDWDEHMREVLRRLYGELGGNPVDLDGKTLKMSTAIVNTQYYLFGIPSGLLAGQITQLENDGLELANCAEWGAGPPEGTDYKLIITMHDLGKAIYGAAQAY
jgi:hypothetical protein